MILLLATALAGFVPAQAQEYDSRGKRDPFLRIPVGSGSYQQPRPEAALQATPATLAALSIGEVSVADLPSVGAGNWHSFEAVDPAHT